MKLDGSASTVDNNDDLRHDCDDDDDHIDQQSDIYSAQPVYIVDDSTFTLNEDI